MPGAGTVSASRNTSTSASVDRAPRLRAARGDIRDPADARPLPKVGTRAVAAVPGARVEPSSATTSDTTAGSSEVSAPYMRASESGCSK